MKFSTTALMLLSFGSSAAFQQPAIGRPITRFMMSDAVAEPDVEEPTTAEEPAAPKPPASGLSMAQVRKQIDDLTKENFSSTLATLEPFLLNEAGATFHAKCLRRIARNAKVVGAQVPEKYAYEAACTAKSRTKQDEYVKAKIAEAAEAASAAEAAAAEASAEQPAEEAPAEEPAAE